jgi:hypothetical protein
MPKKQKTTAEQFDEMFEEQEDFDLGSEFGFEDDLDDSDFGMNPLALTETDENIEDDFGGQEFLEESSGSPVGNFIGNATNLVKENKVATAGIATAIGFGVWKLMSGKKQEQNSQPQQRVSDEYQDELLGLDEEDSIDEFIDTQSSRVNPMFTPLRFK